ncbi:hypothetical protein GCM10009748_07630 [Agromyces lapidis]
MPTVAQGHERHEHDGECDGAEDDGDDSRHDAIHVTAVYGPAPSPRRPASAHPFDVTYNNLE